jgi:hypothetical protein
MRSGDLIQSRNNPNQIYLILKEEVDPHDKLICFTLLDLQGVQRTWAKFSITKVYEVISAQNPDPKCK